MLQDKYRDSFSFAGHDIEVECELLPGEAEPLIKNHIAKGEPGTAEVVLVVSAVKRLNVDGQYLNLQANKPFPRHRDPQTGESLLVRLVKLIVANEPWLATARPFNRVFAEYKDEGENPTRSASLKEAKTGT
jgi:hypothetical protein